jgi:predicted nucleic acid-binding protein
MISEMPESSTVIIADTSCLIILHKIGELDLLQRLFSQVTITPKIAEEYQNELPAWVRVTPPNEKSYRAIAGILDDGEASAIALALDMSDSRLILDDIQARKYAKRLNLSVTGTLGIIALAQKEGIIPSAMKIIDKIQDTNFRLSDRVLARIKQALREQS